MKNMRKSKKRDKKKEPPQRTPPQKRPNSPTDSFESGTDNGKKLAGIFLLIVLIAVLYLVFKVIQPYLNTIIITILLATLWYPVHSRIVKLVKGRESLAAVISCILVILVVVLPLSLLSLALIEQGISSFKAVQSWIQQGGLDKLLNSDQVTWIKEFLKNKVGLETLKFSELSSTLMNFSTGVGQFLFSHGGAIIQNASAILVKFFLMIFILFYFLREGPEMTEWLLHMIPLSKTHEEELITKIRMVSRSAIMGALGTGVAQGIAGGIGLMIVGIPALFWGAMMGFASLVPVVGSALIWAPACIYLLIMGSWGKAVFLALWCMAVVGSIDNFLRPWLMKGEAGMSTLLLFFAILGGLSYFGLIGIIYGPLIFGLCAVLLYIYELEYSSFLKRQDKN